MEHGYAKSCAGRFYANPARITASYRGVAIPGADAFANSGLARGCQ